MGAYALAGGAECGVGSDEEVRVGRAVCPNSQELNWDGSGNLPSAPPNHATNVCAARVPVRYVPVSGALNTVASVPSGAMLDVNDAWTSTELAPPRTAANFGMGGVDGSGTHHSRAVTIFPCRHD